MSIEMQHQIRMNGMDIKNLISDINDWQLEDDPVRIPHTKKGNTLNSLPIRGNAAGGSENSPGMGAGGKENENKKNLLIRDKTQLKDYYNAWENYNPVNILECYLIFNGDMFCLYKELFELRSPGKCVWFMV